VLARAAVLGSLSPALPAGARNSTLPVIDGQTPVLDPEKGFHKNVHIDIIYNGVQLQIPAGIGVAGAYSYQCAAGTYANNSFTFGLDFYWIHTHDPSGILHIEPQNATMTFTLGDLFDVWGQPLNSLQVANLPGPFRIFLYNTDGGGATEYLGDPRLAPLGNSSHDELAIEIGAFTPLPTYTWNYETAPHCQSVSPPPGTAL
jgi:hypothetical protein